MGSIDTPTRSAVGNATSAPVSTEAAGVALLATRVASAVRRADSRGVGSLDDSDLADLDAALRRLDATLKSARGRALPNVSRQLVTIGLHIEATGTPEPPAFTDSLNRVADDLRRLLAGEPARDPNGLRSYYQRLAHNARAASSSPGERIIRTNG